MGYEQVVTNDSELVHHLSRFGIEMTEGEQVLRGFDPLWEYVADTSGFSEGLLLTNQRLLQINEHPASRTSRSSLLTDVSSVQLDFQPRPLWLLLLGIITVVVGIIAFGGKDVPIGELADDILSIQNILAFTLIGTGLAAVVYYFRQGRTTLEFVIGDLHMRVFVPADRLEQASEFVRAYYSARLALDNSLSTSFARNAI